MQNRRELVALILGGVMIAGVVVVFAYSHRQPVFPQNRTADTQSGGLKIPTIDEMCKTLGAAAEDALKQCQADEQAAGEFVFAWMAFNNFIVNGEINLEQIQLIASLDQSDPLAILGAGPDPATGFDPSLGFAPNGATAALLGDPSGSGSQITGGIDPLTGAPLSYLQSPSQLALFCLQMAGDWVTLHDCISENDPSSHVGGVP